MKAILQRERDGSVVVLGGREIRRRRPCVLIGGSIRGIAWPHRSGLIELIPLRMGRRLRSGCSTDSSSSQDGLDLCEVNWRGRWYGNLHWFFFYVNRSRRRTWGSRRHMCRERSRGLRGRRFRRLHRSLHRRWHWGRHRRLHRRRHGRRLGRWNQSRRSHCR